MSRERVAANDVEPYFSARWYGAQVTTGDALEAAKAACIRAWERRIEAIRSLSFESFKKFHLPPALGIDAVTGHDYTASTVENGPETQHEHPDRQQGEGGKDG